LNIIECKKIEWRGRGSRRGIRDGEEEGEEE
jgi:hypothetical protein